jgi:hypothetical protein
MYFVIIALFMLILPVGCTLAEAAVWHGGGLVALATKWFAFWGVGARLGLAGVRQVFNPGFTARDIFGLDDARANPIVRELGFANLALAALGCGALFVHWWSRPAALADAIFYALAGAAHVAARTRNAKQNAAMISDLFMAFALAACLILPFWP